MNSSQSGAPRSALKPVRCLTLSCNLVETYHELKPVRFVGCFVTPDAKRNDSLCRVPTGDLLGGDLTGCGTLDGWCFDGVAGVLDDCIEEHAGGAGGGTAIGFVEAVQQCRQGERGGEGSSVGGFAEAMQQCQRSCMGGGSGGGGGGKIAAAAAARAAQPHGVVVQGVCMCVWGGVCGCVGVFMCVCVCVWVCVCVCVCVCV